MFAMQGGQVLFGFVSEESLERAQANLQGDERAVFSCECLAVSFVIIESACNLGSFFFWPSAQRQCQQQQQQQQQ